LTKDVNNQNPLYVQYHLSPSHIHGTEIHENGRTIFQNIILVTKRSSEFIAGRKILWVRPENPQRSSSIAFQSAEFAFLPSSPENEWGNLAISNRLL
jgi:hypothetical protein